MGSKRPHREAAEDAAGGDVAADPTVDPINTLIQLMREHPVFAALRGTIVAMYARCETGILPDAEGVRASVVTLFQLVDGQVFRQQLQGSTAGFVIPECLRAHALFILALDMGMPGCMGHMLKACHMSVETSNNNVLLPFVGMMVDASIHRPHSHPDPANHAAVRILGPCEDTFLPAVNFSEPDVYMLFTPIERLIYGVVAMDSGWHSMYGHSFSNIYKDSRHLAVFAHETVGDILQEHHLTAALYAATTKPANLQSLVLHGRIYPGPMGRDASLQFLAPPVRDSVSKLYTLCGCGRAILNVLLNQDWARAIYMLSHGHRDSLGMPSDVRDYLHASGDRDDFLRVLRQGALDRHAATLLGDMSTGRMLAIYRGNDQACDRQFFQSLHIQSEVMFVDVDMHRSLSVTLVTASNLCLPPLLSRVASTFYRCKIQSTVETSEELLQGYLLFLRDHRGAKLSDGQLLSLVGEMWEVLRPGGTIKIEVE